MLTLSLISIPLLALNVDFKAEAKVATDASDNETNAATESTNDEELELKAALESAESIAFEAKTYALAATIIAIITAVLSAAMLFKRK